MTQRRPSPFEAQAVANPGDAVLGLQARWPALAECEKTLLARLAAGVRSRSAHRVDMLLVALCHAADPRALAILQSEFGRPLQGALEGAFGTEAAEMATQKALRSVMEHGSQAYDGRGPLAKWLRVVATREAVARLRQAKRRREVGAVVAEELTIAEASVELSLARRQALPQVAAAIKVALGGLEPRQRLLLRLHIVDELPLQKMAAIFHVHRSTMARWCQTALEALQQSALAKLQDQFRNSPSSMKEIAVLVASQVQLSLDRILRKEPF